MQTPEFTMVIGLGNPGEKYLATYHNAGALFVGAIAGHGEQWKKRASFEYIKTTRRIFVRPLLFMNESGSAVRDALRFFKVKKTEFLLAHDDGDIPLGEYRLGTGSGAAGHHGVESVIKALGTKDFWRLRIGIRPPRKTRAKTGDFVLSNMSAKERSSLEELFYLVNLKLKLNEMPDAVVDKLVSGKSML